MRETRLRDAPAAVLEDAFESRPRRLPEFHCLGCGYGASRGSAPDRCPMCGGTTWEYEDWRPFSQLNDDLAPKPRKSTT